MRALFFDGKLEFLTDYPAPERKKDEALVRVTRAGICNTDLEITKGYMGFHGIPGHEFVGVVTECDKKRIIGKRVVGEINQGCGSCEYCRRRMQNHCPNRSVLGIVNKDGAFAEYLTLPVTNLHIVPDSVSDDEAVFAEPLAAAFEILEQVDIGPRNWVCVLGDGKLGLLVAQALSMTGCRLVLVGHHRENLSMMEEIGIQTRLSFSFDESGFDIVVDCTGSRSGIETAMNIARPGGKVVLKTTVARKSSLDLNHVVINELSLIGSRCGPFKPALDAIKSRSVDLYPLISDMFPIDEGEKAFQVASQKGVLKVILRIDES
jgi:threonine dehydrogenase-like Zn-dependent dehydrogenase